MARVSALLTELQDSLAATYAVVEQKIVFGFGDITPHTAPPAIVWMPTDAKYGPAEKDRSRPRRLFTRMPTIVAHCWGLDYDGCEDLVHNLLVALHTAAWGSVDLIGEDWNTGNNVDLGCLALVSFSPRVPVEKRPYRTANLKTIEKDIEGSTSGDGVIDWGEDS